MNINSLGLQTDLIFNKFSGECIDRDNYIVIRTPRNTGYYWGNYLIFRESPKQGSVEEWKRIFDSEFEYYKEPHHYSFSWVDSRENLGEVKPFVDAGFELQNNVVLSASEFKSPPYPNKDILIRKLKSDKDWEDVYDSQVLSADPKYMSPYFEKFKREQMAEYRRMVDYGMGHWFGAFLGEEMVGDLGIFFEGKLARYQSVGTHPDHRRKGVCATLVYEAGRSVKRDFGVEKFVMVADEDYHAARVYESVGFEPAERFSALCWWKKA